MVDLTDLLAMTETETNKVSKPLAMAFVNDQTELDAMDVHIAFAKGTLFGNLDKPFTAGGCVG